MSGQSLEGDALIKGLVAGSLNVGDIWSKAYLEKFTIGGAERQLTVGEERNYLIEAPDV